MVFSSVNPDRRSYLLWRRFSLPTDGGTKDAVAVDRKVGDTLNSAYTFMLEHIVLLSWGIAVLIGVLISIRRYERNHPSTTFTTEIWNNRSSPFDILKVTFKKLFRPSHNRWLVLIWIALAFAFLVVKYAVPIYFARFIIIDKAAPVAPDAIYVPSYVRLDDPRKLLTTYALEVPSALRAAGLIDTVQSDAKRNSSVSVGQPEILKDRGDGELVMRIGYQYNVTGLDFGLQNYPDLALTVEGSCVTEYDWTYSSTFSAQNPSDFVERYNIFNNSKQQGKVSLFDGGKPLAYFFLGDQPPTGPPGNFTWAAIVSSVNRTSYWPGTDPWYRTGDPINSTSGTTTVTFYKVKARRPALSCWQNDVWSYGGKTSSITALNSTALPGLNLPLVLQNILSHFLSQPKIVPLATRLGSSALESASSSLSGIFNASSSSIHADLTRLVFASYIATVNTLTDTTLFATGTDIPNDVLDDKGNIQDGVGEFVIWDGDVSTLSIKALIIIPTLALALWIIFILLMLSPIPGKEVSSLAVPAGRTEKDERNDRVEKEAEAEDESPAEKVVNAIVKQVEPVLSGDNV